MESQSLSQHAEVAVESPSPSRRQRTEVTPSVAEPEPCDDNTDRDTADQLWRPYYSYKPKKKSKKLRSRHRKERCFSYSMTPIKSMACEDYRGTSHRGEDESFSSDSLKRKRCLRNNSPKPMFTCNICSSNFITESGLKAHIIGLHPSFCRICSKQGPPGEAPISGTCQASGEFVCESCMESGSCFDNMARSPSTEKRYRCAFCPQRFLYLATKKSHEKKHQETIGKGYNSDYTTFPKNTCRPEKQQPQCDIKTEEGEDQDTDRESKESMDSFSVDKLEPMTKDRDVTDDYMSLTPKIEDSVRTDKIGNQNTVMKSNCINTMFSLSPSEMKIKKSKNHLRINYEHQTYLTSKWLKPECTSREPSSYETRTDSQDDYRQPLPTWWKKDFITKGCPLSSHKPEKTLYKEEPTFQTHN